jgi:ABC-type transport system involved in multi-copper enzyme maturation permease subunit
MFNPAVAWHTFQQHHWIRISLLGIVLLWVYLGAGAIDHFPLIGITPFLVWLLGAGIIGRDMSSGVAHLLFTRPISRNSYVFTKWASLVLAVAAFQCIFLLVWFVSKYLIPIDSHGGPDLTSSIFYQTIREFIFSLWIAGSASTVLIFFSTVISGWGDLALLLYANTLVLILEISPLRDLSHFDRVIYGFMWVIWPGSKLGYEYMNSDSFSQPFTWPHFSDFVIDGGIAGCYFVLALFIMARKDMGYTNI